MEKIAFFDLAPGRAGWCVGVGDSTPTTGVIEFDDHGDDLGGLGLQFLEHLNLLHARFGFTVAGNEKPLLLVNVRGKNGNRRTDTLDDLRRIYGLGFTLATWCAQRQIPFWEETVQAVKKESTRNHTAEKKEVADQIEKIGIDIGRGPGRLDRADAASGWLIGVRTWNPHLSAAWDRKLFSAVGALRS